MMARRWRGMKVYIYLFSLSRSVDGHKTRHLAAKSVARRAPTAAFGSTSGLCFIASSPTSTVHKRGSGSRSAGPHIVTSHCLGAELSGCIGTRHRTERRRRALLHAIDATVGENGRRSRRQDGRTTGRRRSGALHAPPHESRLAKRHLGDLHGPGDGVLVSVQPDHGRVALGGLRGRAGARGFERRKAGSPNASPCTTD